MSVRNVHVLPLMLSLWMGILASGCEGVRKAPENAGTADQSSARGLSGTSWRLVEFQSMSDEVGTIRPEDSNLYTISFHPDSTVALRLNCNRGNGTWSAVPSSPTRARLTFGPIATTRALCPPPSLDEDIARDLDFVRSYVLEDERLHMSLMADAGIYVWEEALETEEP